jgi:hypothetical protein
MILGPRAYLVSEARLEALRSLEMESLEVAEFGGFESVEGFATASSVASLKPLASAR